MAKHAVSHRKHKKARVSASPPIAWGTWLTGSCVAAMLLLFFSLVIVIATKGLRSFWVDEVYAYQLRDGRQLLAQIVEQDEEQGQLQLYIANRDLYGLDYTWIESQHVTMQGKPSDVVVLERQMNGKAMGRLTRVVSEKHGNVSQGDLFLLLEETLESVAQEREKLHSLRAQMSSISSSIEALDDEASSAEKQQQEQAFAQLNQLFNARQQLLRSQYVMLLEAGGARMQIPLLEVLDAYQPNQFTTVDKVRRFFSNIWTLLSDAPRASNTEGGLFPAIFGTVLLVFLMSLMCVPLGVVAAVYLKEYARKGLMVYLVRISVNNLAGVPSIIYGVFGLGLFVYGIGGSIDQLFFADKLPIPTFGTGGMLWSAMTMALLTLPVVIVATEEGLESVPQNIRDGSMAMGATQFQTLVRVILPMASPGILTGFILAIARAAGEVAPLMLVGAIKSAPTLPISASFPFFHFDRKFMHLGYHLYDQAFLSSSVEASKPMVFATSLLLLLLVLMMSMTAMVLRNHMRKRYVTDLF